MRQRGMKLFLAFMVMIGLFGMGVPVEAEEADEGVNAPITAVYWDFNPNTDITIVVSDGQNGYFTAIKKLRFNTSGESKVVDISFENDISGKGNTVSIKHGVFSSAISNLDIVNFDVIADLYNDYKCDSENISGETPPDPFSNEPSDVPDGVSLAEYGYTGTSLSVVIEYDDSVQNSEYIQKILNSKDEESNNAWIDIQDSNHQHSSNPEEDTAISIPFHQCSIDSTSESGKITITYTGTEISDLNTGSLNIEISVAGYYNLGNHTGPEPDGQDGDPVPSSVTMQSFELSEDNVLTVILTGGPDCGPYFGQMMKPEPEGFILVTDDTHPHTDADGDPSSPTHKEFSECRISADNQGNVTITVTLDSGFDADTLNVEIMVPRYQTLDINTNKNTPGPGPTPSGNKNVPVGTKISGVTNAAGDALAETFTISCPAADASCKAYLDEVEKSGVFMLNDKDHDEIPCTTTTLARALTDDNRDSLTISASDFPACPSSSGWHMHSLHGMVAADGYKDVRQDDESASYDPIRNACKLSLVDTETYTYEINCSSDVFAMLDSNTSIELNLDNDEDRPRVNLSSPYTVTDGNKKLTFNYDNLERSGTVIKDDDYRVVMVIRRTNSKDFPGIRHVIADDPAEDHDYQLVHFPDVNNKQTPSGVKVNTVEKEAGTGLQITCDKGKACAAYLDKMYTDSKKGMIPGGTDFFAKNSGFMLYSQGMRIPVVFPVDENVFTRIQEDGMTVALEVQPEHIIEDLGIESGTVYDDGMVGVLGYGTQSLNQFNDGTTITITNGANPVENAVISQNKNGELVVTSSNLEFLEAANKFDITTPNGTSGGDLITKEWRKIEEVGDGTYQLTISLKDLFEMYAWTEAGEKMVKVSGGKYFVTKSLNLAHNFERMPSDVRISVVGDGLRISNTNTTDRKFLEIVADETQYNPLLEELNTRIDFLDDDGSIVLYVARSEFPYEYETGADHIDVPITWDELLKLGVKEGEEYRFDLLDSHYGGFGLQHFVLPLNPIRLAYYAENPEKFDTAELAEMDALAVTVGDSGLKNVTVLRDPEEVNEVNVDVYGTVAAAITTDNSGGAEISDLNYDDPNIEITVKTDVTNLTEDEAQQVIDQYDSDAEITPTSVHFDVSIEKSYNEASGKGDEPVEIKVLPYKAGLEFELPSEELPEGQYYHLLREHDGKVEEVTDFETVEVDGVKKGVAYSEKFSSFVLVTSSEKPSPVDPVTPSKPDNAVKPSSETQSNTKKNVSIHVDNVVTCQMAGYPAGYAWNEAAKACQPGFLDNAGVFHSTAVRKAGVPNTYDRGLGGSIAGLITSALTAIIAAYILKMY